MEITWNTPRKDLKPTKKHSHHFHVKAPQPQCFPLPVHFNLSSHPIFAGFPPLCAFFNCKILHNVAISPTPRHLTNPAFHPPTSVSRAPPVPFSPGLPPLSPYTSWLEMSNCSPWIHNCHCTCDCTTPVPTLNIVRLVTKAIHEFAKYPSSSKCLKTWLMRCL